MEIRFSSNVWQQHVCHYCRTEGLNWLTPFILSLFGPQMDLILCDVSHQRLHKAGRKISLFCYTSTSLRITLNKVQRISHRPYVAYILSASSFTSYASYIVELLTQYSLFFKIV